MTEPGQIREVRLQSLEPFSAKPPRKQLEESTGSWTENQLKSESICSTQFFQCNESNRSEEDIE